VRLDRLWYLGRVVGRYENFGCCIVEVVIQVQQYVCAYFIAIRLRDNAGDGVVVRPWCGWS